MNAPNPKSYKQLQNPRNELLASHGSLKNRRNVRISFNYRTTYNLKNNKLPEMVLLTWLAIYDGKFLMTRRFTGLLFEQQYLIQQYCVVSGDFYKNTR